MVRVGGEDEIPRGKGGLCIIRYARRSGLCIYA